MAKSKKAAGILARYRELSSPIISDAMDAAGIHGTIDGIASQVAGKRMCGFAYTVRYTPAEAARGRFADFLDEVPEGAVVAIDNGGRTDVSVWGDTLSLFATRHAFAGAVIDGVCRDIDGTRALGLPMFSRGTFMRTGKNRIGVESTQQPIHLGPILVSPGDLIFGDDTGCVAVPAGRLEEVLANAERIVKRDAACHAAIERGAPMSEVWEAGAKAV